MERSRYTDTSSSEEVFENTDSYQAADDAEADNYTASEQEENFQEENEFAEGGNTYEAQAEDQEAPAQNEYAAQQEGSENQQASNQYESLISMSLRMMRKLLISMSHKTLKRRLTSIKIKQVMIPKQVMSHMNKKHLTRLVLTNRHLTKLPISTKKIQKKRQNNINIQALGCFFLLNETQKIINKEIISNV